jgi:hypothetical protein
MIAMFIVRTLQESGGLPWSAQAHANARHTAPEAISTSSAAYSPLSRYGEIPS